MLTADSLTADLTAIPVGNYISLNDGSTVGKISKKKYADCIIRILRNVCVWIILMKQ